MDDAQAPQDALVAQGDKAQPVDQLAEEARIAREIAEQRHMLKCYVCRHPDRVEIERAFLDWRTLATIWKDWGIAPNEMRRHEAFFRLHERRSASLRGALGRIVAAALEGVDPTTITLDQALKAAEIATRMEKKQAPRGRQPRGVVPADADPPGQLTWEERIEAHERSVTVTRTED